jgi:hypothetical protein
MKQILQAIEEDIPALCEFVHDLSVRKYTIPAELRQCRFSLGKCGIIELDKRTIKGARLSGARRLQQGAARVYTVPMLKS